MIQKIITKFLAIVRKIKSVFTQKTKKEYSSNSADTARGMGGDLIKYIQDANQVDPGIHDIKIKLESNIQDYLIRNGCSIDGRNKGILLEMITEDPCIKVKILAYPNTVQIDIGCSFKPYSYDPAGAQKLAHLLFAINRFLCSISGHRATIQEVAEWLMTHYHYGQDGKLAYDGEKFHITCEDALGEFVRAYDKTLIDGRRIIRLEKICAPKTTVKEELQKMMMQEVLK